MEFKVLAVGDVVGNPGMERIRRNLRRLKGKTGANFTVVNGENASVVGITPDQAEDILDAGADVIPVFCGQPIWHLSCPVWAGRCSKPLWGMWR